MKSTRRISRPVILLVSNPDPNSDDDEDLPHVSTSVAPISDDNEHAVCGPNHADLTAALTSSPEPASSATERLLITSAANPEYHLIVEITGATDTLAIRERIFSKLGIPDEERQAYSIYRAEFGEREPIIDHDLTIYCASWSDSQGTLKLLVQQNPAAASAVPASSLAPPQSLHSSPVPFFPVKAGNESNMRPSPRIKDDGTIPSDRDRLPWDQISNGYDVSIDERRQQQPRVIHFEPPRSIDATIRSEARPQRNLFPASIFYSPPALSRPPAIQQQIQSSLASNRPRPIGTIAIQNSTTPTPPLSMVSSTINPTSLPIHRRHGSGAAVQLEPAIEALERVRKAQQTEYGAQIQRSQVNMDRQSPSQSLIQGDWDTPRDRASPSPDIPRLSLTPASAPPAILLPNTPPQRAYPHPPPSPTYSNPHSHPPSLSHGAVGPRMLARSQQPPPVDPSWVSPWRRASSLVRTMRVRGKPGGGANGTKTGLLPEPLSPEIVETHDAQRDDGYSAKGNTDDASGRLQNTSAAHILAPVATSPRMNNSQSTTHDIVRKVDDMSLSISEGPDLAVQIAPALEDHGSPSQQKLATAMMPHSHLLSTPTERALTPTPGAPYASDGRTASFPLDTRKPLFKAYEGPQEYFPDHNLNKVPISPASDDIFNAESSPVHGPAPVKENRSRHRRSIKVIAEERKKALDDTIGNLVRKTSIKVWGSKILERIHGHKSQGQDSAEVQRQHLSQDLMNLGSYRIPLEDLEIDDTSVIGRGGFGVVVCGKLSGYPSVVAVKRLRSDETQDIRVAKRLIREMKAWSKLRHPNILPLIGFYLSVNLDLALVVCPIQPNGNVRDYLQRVNPSILERLRLALDTLCAIEYLHNLDPPVVHGDIKALNILMSDERRAVLCDFGLAIAADEVQSGLTTSKGFKGSVRYCSPELVMEDEARRWPPSDMWAWGCLFVEIMKEIVPYPRQRNDFQVISALQRGDLPGSEDLLKDPINFWPIVQNCWHADPQMRSTAKTSLIDLRLLIAASSTDVSSFTVPQELSL
ncbi:hypothetical protein FRB93_006839 [Tulasnella sp. JGI-2019a]|nr:hypothetical protein FRB93_006839 [Tulasnella sp. JGI-2019a]